MTGATELRTERLLLRPFSLSDVDDVLEYGSDPEWAAFYDHPYDIGEAEDMVARAVLTSWDEHPWFALELDGRVIGMAVLSLERRDIANLGYDVAKPHWGKGLAPEAARAVVDWAFRELGLSNVTAYADARNRQSWRVMEKLGMTREGLMRRRQGRESVAYGVLREDWRSDDGPCLRLPRGRPIRRPRRYPSCARRDSSSGVSARATSTTPSRTPGTPSGQSICSPPSHSHIRGGTPRSSLRGRCGPPRNRNLPGQ